MQAGQQPGDLSVGGVFVRMFLRDPKFPLRHPKKFLEGLLDQYTAATSALATAQSASARSLSSDEQWALLQKVELLAAALLALLRSQPSLCDHVAQLGYPMKIAAVLGLPFVTSGVLGGESEEQWGEGEGEKEGVSPAERVRLSCLRLVHLMAANKECAEQLSAAGTAANTQVR